MPLVPGTRLGNYDVIGPLGAGGMGEVYRARDVRLGRDVALKVLPASVAGDADRLVRFRREAQLLASLNDPHIAQVFGFEDVDGVHALVMELVEGPTLEDRLRRGPMSVAEALAIARQLASALDTAHSQGIIHRDLKPANIKLKGADDPGNDSGAVTVKVLDFGLAKALDPGRTMDPSSPADSPTMTSPATTAGLILGTASYMAPEQARGRPVDKRADIWAFGVVLFEMLSGRRLFDGEDVSEMLAAVLRQEIDWTRLPADTPRAVRALLRRCLERDRTRRLRDIGDAWSDLDGAPDPIQPNQAGASSLRPRARWLPWTIAVASFAAALASLSWALAHGGESTAAPLVVRSQITSDVQVLFVDVSRDGTRIVYTVQTGDSRGAHLALRELQEFAGHPIPGAEGGSIGTISPDGRFVAFHTLGTPYQIRRIPIEGGASTFLANGDFLNGGDWGPDGTVVWANRGIGQKPVGLFRVAASGGTPEPLTTVDTGHGERSHVHPRFIDDRRLLFTIVTDKGRELAVLDLPTRQYKRIGQAGSSGTYVRPGYLVYLRDATLFARPFDVSRLTLGGAEIPVASDVQVLNNRADYAVSDAGVFVYGSNNGLGDGTSLAWTDRTGKTERLPGPSRQLWGRGRLSPDGRMIANTISTAAGDSDLWTLDVARGTLTRLTFGVQAGTPIWSPDNRRIVFGSRDRKDGSASYLDIVAADGSSPPRHLIDLGPTTTASPHSFAPDGSTLIFSKVDDVRHLYVVAIDANGAAGTPRRLFDGPTAEVDGEVSPDGRWIAYQSAESGDWDVYVRPFPGPGPKTRISTDLGQDPRWSRDGRELFYFGGKGALLSVPWPGGAEARPGAPQTLFTMPRGTTWDVTPQHDRLLIELPKLGAGSTINIVTNWFEELRQRAKP
jgi:serine/threonine-protein kinase